MSTFPAPPPPDNATERAAAAKRLKAAWTSMILSGGISLLLLAYLAWRIIAGLRNPNPNGGNNAFLFIGAIVLVRLGITGYRLYNKWNALKAAQEHHRSFQ